MLANIEATRAGNASNNLGGGLVTDAVQIPEHTFRRLLQDRGLGTETISDLRNTFDGPVFARHGVVGDQLVVTETSLGAGSGRFVTRGSAGSTPELRRSLLALPDSNLALIESPAYISRP